MGKLIAGGLTVVTCSIGGVVADQNVYSAAVATGWSGGGIVVCVCTISAGAVITHSTGFAALVMGA